MLMYVDEWFNDICRVRVNVMRFKFGIEDWLI